MKIIRIGCLLTVLLPLLLSCQRFFPQRYLVSARVTHFSIVGREGDLNFPMIAQIKDIDAITKDIDEAEYYYKKLSSVYQFKSFVYQQSDKIDTILTKQSLENPLSFSRLTHSPIPVAVELTGIDDQRIRFIVRSQSTGAKKLEYPVEILSGKSASVGILHDTARLGGTLVVISVWIMKVDHRTTSTELVRLLEEKNSVRGSLHSHPRFIASDQRIIDQVLGVGKYQLPMETFESPQIQHKNLAEVDIPTTQELDEMPRIVGGMASLTSHLYYPASARRDNVGGKVLISIMIDTSGNIVEKRVLRSVRNDIDSMALKALDSIRFTQPRVKGHSVRVWVTLPIAFQLNK